MNATADRVALHTSEDVNREIEEKTNRSVKKLLNHQLSAIDLRIKELEHEWDIERTLQFNASALSLGGLVLGAVVHPRIFGFQAVIASFLLQHALQGWCPPLPIFRAKGIRTEREIAEELHALKIIRGDYSGLSKSRNPQALLAAATK